MTLKINYTTLEIESICAVSHPEAVAPRYLSSCVVYFLLNLFIMMIFKLSKVHRCFPHLYIRVPHTYACLGTVEAGRGQWITWNWSYRWL